MEGERQAEFNIVLASVLIGSAYVGRCVRSEELPGVFVLNIVVRSRVGEHVSFGLNKQRYFWTLLGLNMALCSFK
jgi:hypothetical protein